MHHETRTLASPHARLEFDAETGSVRSLRGRFDEDSEYGPELLTSTGISWRVDTGMHPETMSQCDEMEATADSLRATVTISDREGPSYRTRWNIRASQRGVEVESEIEMLREHRVSGILLDISCAQWFVAGLFERGLVQQICSGALAFASHDELAVFYTMDARKGSVAVVPEQTTGSTVLVRDEPHGAVGLQFLAVGGVITEDVWVEREWQAQSVVNAGDRFSQSFTVYSNDLPFPAHAVDGKSFGDVRSAQTHYSALYGSAGGTLGGYAVQGSAYPTIAMPRRNYWTLHTFFDPDAWSTVNTLAHSGDPLWEREARRVLERALSGMTADGQIPHHFDVEEPVFVAIAGTPQTGPNIFWSLAALEYSTATGDDDWLRTVWSDGIRRTVDWILEQFDPERGLLCVGGPLWVDVFRREGYTFDTNAIAVYLLEKVAFAADHLGDSGLRYREIAATIRKSIEAFWDGDHYVTARSADWSTVHDMVDSEGYFAVAFDLVDADRATAVLDRLDRIPDIHPGGKGTWVSERYYGVDECHLGNTGDSETAMGRQWWADLLARVRRGDAETFFALYTPVQDDLLELTWMRERYGRDGSMIRATGYHEYPEILDRMLREGVYGLTMTHGTVRVDPMSSAPFSIANGRYALERNSDGVTVVVPGSGDRVYMVYGFTPGDEYSLPTGSRATADDKGSVTFTAEAGVAQRVARVAG